MQFPVSVLDLSPVGAGVAPSQAIRDSAALAQTADELGFTRYWFAEHHNMASIGVGGPRLVGDQLVALARDLGVNELMLSTLVPDLAARRASLERIATALS